VSGGALATMRTSVEHVINRQLSSGEGERILSPKRMVIDNGLLHDGPGAFVAGGTIHHFQNWPR